MIAHGARVCDGVVYLEPFGAIALRVEELK
jgi:hypothetical protein